MTKKHLQSLFEGDIFWIVPRRDEAESVVDYAGHLMTAWVPIPCQVVKEPNADVLGVPATLIRAKNLRTGKHIFADVERSHLTYEACVKALSAQMKALI